MSVCSSPAYSGGLQCTQGLTMSSISSTCSLATDRMNNGASVDSRLVLWHGSSRWTDQ